MKNRMHAIALALAVAVTASAATALAAAPEKITGGGVGPVKLGATFTQLHSHQLVGNLARGCELSGPNARSAKLSAPLKGSVDFSQTSPRKVTDIGITGGATARGVGIGATIAQIKARFPKAKVDHSSEHTFGITLVKIPKNGGGAFQFGVDTKTKRATSIGIPFIAFCD